MERLVYNFGDGDAQGDASMASLLGGKGAGLCEMAKLGLPVPPGFVVSTLLSRQSMPHAHGELPDAITAELRSAIVELERITTRGFGSKDNPLLISVRSGAPISMPGMMDTVLNVGLNDDTVRALARQSGNEVFALDCYRRFISMYGSVVLDVPPEFFDKAQEKLAKETGSAELDLKSPEVLSTLISRYKGVVQADTGEAFPGDVWKQLFCAISAVLQSWHSVRAQSYRQMHNISNALGTAVVIQSMVFGNRGKESATGVAFTRNPSTGENQLFGEFLPDAQGEDVVAGLQTPNPLTRANASMITQGKATLQQHSPDAFGQLRAVSTQLEQYFGDLQDIEFTIEQGKLWLLQARSGKRTTIAGIRIAVEMADEGLISREEAIGRIDPASLVQLLHPTLDPEMDQPVVATGLPASPGAAAGEVVFTPEDAEALLAENRQAILVRAETSPEDIRGMHASSGILTSKGGMTSHAAVVARGMGKPCIVGSGSVRIDLDNETFSVGGRVIARGDVITLDGSTGRVYSGHVRQVQPDMSGYFITLMDWVDEVGGLKVRANADTPHDAEVAREFGASGIGLCRSERMLFEEDRVMALREMILAHSEKRRVNALTRLVEAQRKDFVQIFETMAGSPVAIRLLDPPFHEFLPTESADIEQVAASLDLELSDMEHRIVLLKEINPMMGNRGCRMLIAYPEIIEMQARAIFEAAEEAAANTGREIKPEIMIPVVGMDKEQVFIRNKIDEVASTIEGVVEYRVGTIIEVPRASLISHKIAETADFLTFGTNDLTQTTYGISRDDASKYWRSYERHQILSENPFITLDQDGVGELMRISIERGRKTDPNLEIGICGEHGGDPVSVAYCHDLGIDYVSCSPYRVPIARLAAAQAKLKSVS